MFEPIIYIAMIFLVIRSLLNRVAATNYEALSAELRDTRKQLEKLKAIVAEVTDDFYKEQGEK